MENQMLREKILSMFDREKLEGKIVEAHVVLDNTLVTQDTVDTLVTKE